MHDGLADSLFHISEQTSAVAEIDQAALGRVIAGIRSGERYPPAAFGHYYEIAFALFDESLSEAGAASRRLGTVAPFSGGMRVRTIGDPAMAEDAALYLRRLGEDADWFRPPPPGMASEFSERLDAGFALLDRMLPGLAAEIRALIREIALATGVDGGSMQFDGASAYQLWGLLLLNPRFHPTPLAVAEVLAHESAHSLLFGFTYDEPLVLNDDAELYPSPLRSDPRPMDGIYHATFVSARMHWAMTILAGNAGLSSEERALAAKAATDDARNFAAGHRVVVEHGRLSGTGRALMEGALAHMAAA